MRRMFSLLTMAAAVIVLGLAIVEAQADPAIVVHKGEGGICGMLGSDANGNPIFGGFGVVTHIVENDNKATLKCKGENLTNLSGKTQTYTGFLCGIILPSDGSFVVTSDTHANVTKDGKGHLTCTYDKTP